MSGTLTRIKKRDGEISDFVHDKITTAIYKAMESKGIDDRRAAQSVSDIVKFVLEEKFGGYTTPSVEQIQDIVEKVLMKQGYHDVAKAYILYRERHKDIREAKKVGINLERLIKDSINDADWRIRENSNEGVQSFSGLNARIAGQVLTNFALNHIYSEDVKRAHVEGDMHIHDLSYPIVGYCRLLCGLVAGEPAAQGIRSCPQPDSLVPRQTSGDGNPAHGQLHRDHAGRVCRRPGFFLRGYPAGSFCAVGRAGLQIRQAGCAETDLRIERAFALGMGDGRHPFPT